MIYKQIWFIKALLRDSLNKCICVHKCLHKIAQVGVLSVDKPINSNT